MHTNVPSADSLTPPVGRQGIIELMKCRLTLKNFAWNQHWLMFVPYGVLKEVWRTNAPALVGTQSI